MIASTRPVVCQPFADNVASVSKAFEMGDQLRHRLHERQVKPVRAASLVRHSFSLSLRTGLTPIEPTFTTGAGIADCANTARNTSAADRIALNYVRIKQTDLGTSPCRRDCSFFSCWLPRLRAAWQIRHRGALPVAGSNWACHPADQPTDLTARKRMP